MKTRAEGTSVVVALLMAVMAGGVQSAAAQPPGGNQPITGNAKQKFVADSAVEPAEGPGLPKDIDFNSRVFIGGPDGSTMKPLLNLPEYDIQSMPSWSSDGSRIALEAWRSAYEEVNDDSKIVVVNADGSQPRILGDGGMPSFSPRGDRLVIRRVDPNKGIWVMSSEGPEKELIPIAAEGWNARWSPVGEQLVYITYGANPNLVVFDLAQKTRTLLFEQGNCPYSSFLWNVAWSPDGKKIAFKGKRVADGKWELGIVDARGASQGLATRIPSEVWSITWCADCNRIFFSLPTPSRGGRMQLYSVDPDNKVPPQILAGQDPGRRNSLALHSPDGKKLLMVSSKPAPKSK